jgi:hypothetical protein
MKLNYCIQTTSTNWDWKLIRLWEVSERIIKSTGDWVLEKEKWRKKSFAFFSSAFEWNRFRYEIVKFLFENSKATERREESLKSISVDSHILLLLFLLHSDRKIYIRQQWRKNWNEKYKNPILQTIRSVLVLKLLVILDFDCCFPHSFSLTSQPRGDIFLIKWSRKGFIYMRTWSVSNEDDNTRSELFFLYSIKQ